MAYTSARTEVSPASCMCSRNHVQILYKKTIVRRTYQRNQDRDCSCSQNEKERRKQELHVELGSKNRDVWGSKTCGLVDGLMGGLMGLMGVDQYITLYLNYKPTDISGASGWWGNAKIGLPRM